MIYENIELFWGYKKDGQRLVAIDYGKRKTGIAVSDRTLTIANPYKVITTSKFQYLVSQIIEIVQEINPWGIVIGFPMLHREKNEAFISLINALSSELSQKLSLPILLEDEYMTSRTADDLLKNLQYQRKKRNEIDDMVSASILLERVISKLKM